MAYLVTVRLAHLGEDAVAGVRVDISVARRVRLQGGGEWETVRSEQ